MTKRGRIAAENAELRERLEQAERERDAADSAANGYANDLGAAQAEVARLREAAETLVAKWNPGVDRALISCKDTRDAFCALKAALAHPREQQEHGASPEGTGPRSDVSGGLVDCADDEGREHERSDHEDSSTGFDSPLAPPDLARFARGIMEAYPDGLDEDVWDVACASGVLVGVRKAAPCSNEACACADGGVVGETTCYEVHPALSGSSAEPPASEDEMTLAQVRALPLARRLQVLLNAAVPDGPPITVAAHEEETREWRVRCPAPTEVATHAEALRFFLRREHSLGVWGGDGDVARVRAAIRFFAENGERLAEQRDGEPVPKWRSPAPTDRGDRRDG